MAEQKDCPDCQSLPKWTMCQKHIDGWKALRSELAAVKAENERMREAINTARPYLKGLDSWKLARTADAVLKAALATPKAEKPKPDWYYKGGEFTTYKAGVDPEVTCWHCGKTFLCDALDATCRMCDAPYAKSRCAEFGFVPKPKPRPTHTMPGVPQEKGEPFPRHIHTQRCVDGMCLGEKPKAPEAGT